MIAGIDIGSGFIKTVILDDAAGRDAAVLGRGQVRTGVDLEKAARQALALALDEAALPASAIAYVATTGFGRYSLGFRDIQITEITSGARGVRFLYPGADAILDIGGQSTRAISLNPAGKVAHFKTNDKCAAGSGSFIVRAAKYLQIPLEQAGDLALQALKPQPISSICAVLAESEIINHVSAGTSVEDILCGIYESLADRSSLLLKRVGMRRDLVFIGGVARQQGMVRALEQRLGVRVDVPPHAEFVCALGAALLGLQRRRAAAGASMSLGGSCIAAE